MKYSVATNFQDELVRKLNKKDVSDIYGKLTADFIGGSRPSYVLPSVNLSRLKRHVAAAHREGLGFNYLLNAVCLSNKEYTRSGLKRIHRILNELLRVRVDSVTVAIPFLLQLIKKSYPSLKVHVSIGAKIDSVNKALFWEDLGADLLNLDSGISRDFETMADIRKSVKCRLQLVANNACLYDCPLNFYHLQMNAHASQSDDPSRGYVIDYCILNCRYLRLKDPANFIRADWIRPEDVRFYEEAGIDSLKIVDRSADTGSLCRAVEAYTNRSYKGNLMDLFLNLSAKSFYSGIPRLLRGVRYFLRPLQADLSLVYKISGLLSPLEVGIDNQALEGFLRHFIDGKCRGLCLECGYCAGWAKESVSIDRGYCERTLSRYQDVLRDLTHQKKR